MKHRAKVFSVWECCILIQTLIVLCGVVHAQQPTVRSAFDKVVQAVEQGGLTSLDPTMITALGRNVAGTSNDSLAAAVESGELQAEVTAGGKVPLKSKWLPPQLRAAGLVIAGETQLVGGETGGASISMHDLFEMKISQNLKDRTLGVTYVLKTPGSGVALRRVPVKWRKFLEQNGGGAQIVMEYKFKTETDLIAATGADLNFVPLFPTTKKLTENMVRAIQGKTPEPLLDSPSSPSEMIAGVMPEVFKAAGRCESMKAGFAVKMATPAGAVTVRKMTQYGTEAGEPVAKPYVDVIVSKEVKAEAMDAEAKLEGAVSYSTLKRPPQPEAKIIADATRKSGLGGIVEAAPASMLPFKTVRGNLGRGQRGRHRAFQRPTAGAARGRERRLRGALRQPQARARQAVPH